MGPVDTREAAPYAPSVTVASPLPSPRPAGPSCRRVPSAAPPSQNLVEDARPMQPRAAVLSRRWVT
jgi:hypothetical protein